MDIINTFLAHFSPETCAALVLFLASEILGATDNTQANGIVQFIVMGLKVAARAVVQALPKGDATPIAMTAADMQTAIQQAVQTEIAKWAAPGVRVPDQVVASHEDVMKSNGQQ